MGNWKGEEGLLTLPFYLLVVLFNGFGGEKVSKTTGPNDITIKTVLKLSGT